MNLATSQRVRLTPRALADLKNIANYTEKTWGKKQRNLYLINLNKRLVFYLITSPYIDIIGVLHRNMDISNYFSRDKK